VLTGVLMSVGLWFGQGARPQADSPGRASQAGRVVFGQY